MTEDSRPLLNDRHRHFTWDEANAKTDQSVKIVIDKAESPKESNKHSPIKQSIDSSTKLFSSHYQTSASKMAITEDESPRDEVLFSAFSKDSKPLHHSVSFAEPLPHYTPSHSMAVYGTFDEQSGRRPVVPLCISYPLPVDDPEAERMAEWRQNRWKALHELHIGSLDSELNHRALLLIDSLILLCLSVILLVMSSDNLAVVDASLMLLVMALCYAVSQTRIHAITMMLWISTGVMLILHLAYLVYSAAGLSLKLSKHPGLIALQFGISASLFLMFLLSLDLFKIESRTDEWKSEEKEVDAMNDFSSRKEHEIVEELEKELREAVPLA